MAREVVRHLRAGLRVEQLHSFRPFSLDTPLKRISQAEGAGKGVEVDAEEGAEVGGVEEVTGAETVGDDVARHGVAGGCGGVKGCAGPEGPLREPSVVVGCLQGERRG